MRLLLDTRVLLWWLSRDPRLNERANGAIRDTTNGVFVSAASAWEISVKVAKGLLKAPDNLAEVLVEKSLTPLPVTVRHGAAVRELPLLHHDPFDRLLVAQARCEDLVLVTADDRLSAYDVAVLPAEG